MAALTSRDAYGAIEATKGGHFERQRVSEVKAQLDLGEACPIEHVSIEACIGISSASNRSLERAAVTFHGERPTCPDRAGGDDAICNV